MKTLNFDLRYIEIALSKIEEIEECDHMYIVWLISYLQSVEKYSVDFPKKIKFRLPNGKRDHDYDDLQKWLIERGYFKKENKSLIRTKRGKFFFKMLEEKCIEASQAFEHYNLTRC